MPKKKDDGTKIVADNRKARYAYAIDETFEAGIMLVGSEVKSLRNGKATIAESYAQAKDGEITLVNAYIPEYTQASRFNHEPKRTRKLLAHKREVNRLAAAIQREGMTLIPLKLYFNAVGRAKLGHVRRACVLEQPGDTDSRDELSRGVLRQGDRDLHVVLPATDAAQRGQGRGTTETRRAQLRGRLLRVLARRAVGSPIPVHQGRSDSDGAGPRRRRRPAGHGACLSMG